MTAKKTKMLLFCSILLAALVLALSILSSFLKISSSKLIEVDFDKFNKNVFVKDGYYYIGKDSCGDCAVFYPKLLHLIAKYKINVYYFNATTYQKSTDSTYAKLIDSLNIHYIPAIIITKGGEIYSVISEGDIADLFESELKSKED